MTKLIMTIDGPAAAGKGTISYLISRKYGLQHLDSGAFYRAATWLAIHRGIPMNETSEPRIVEALKQFPIELTTDMSGLSRQVTVHCADQDITDQIRAEHISQLAPIVGGMQLVRQQITSLQRIIAEKSIRGVVAEGRDTGIVVFPEAQLKFFLTAAPEVRAQRRHAELVDSGLQISFEQVYSDIQDRDRRDTERVFSALRAAENSKVIDSTDLTLEQVVSQINGYIDTVLAEFHT